MDLARPAEARFKEGRLTHDQANRLLHDLTMTNQGGSFFAYGTIVVAAGQVAPS